MWLIQGKLGWKGESWGSERKEERWLLDDGSLLDSRTIGKECASWWVMKSFCPLVVGELFSLTEENPLNWHYSCLKKAHIITPLTQNTGRFG